MLFNMVFHAGHWHGKSSQIANQFHVDSTAKMQQNKLAPDSSAEGFHHHYLPPQAMDGWGRPSVGVWLYTRPVMDLAKDETETFRVSRNETFQVGSYQELQFIKTNVRMFRMSAWSLRESVRVIYGIWQQQTLEFSTIFPRGLHGEHLERRVQVHRCRALVPDHHMLSAHLGHLKMASLRITVGRKRATNRTLHPGSRRGWGDLAAKQIMHQ